jgi:hypothetical protein
VLALTLTVNPVLALTLTFHWVFVWWEVYVTSPLQLKVPVTYAPTTSSIQADGKTADFIDPSGLKFTGSAL